MARRFVWLLAVLVPLGVLATLPASLFLGGSQDGFSFERVEGRVWAGQALIELPNQAPLPVSWRWSGGVVWDWLVASDAINLEGQWRLSDRSTLSEIRGEVDVQALDAARWLVVTWPQGVLDVDIPKVHWTRPDTLVATGQVTWQAASLAGLVNESLGDVAVSLRPSESAPGHTEIRIQTLDAGAVMVAGDVLTNGDRYQANITLTPDPSRSDVLRFFQSLGRSRDGTVVIERSGQLGVF